MDIETLKSELITDPLGRGYAGMTDQQTADSLNAANRTTTRGVIDSYEVIEATVPTDWSNLSSAEKQRYQTIVSTGQVNMAGTNTRAMLAAMFGAGTQTRANLTALQNGPSISRATELGLTRVGPHHVAEARA